MNQTITQESGTECQGWGTNADLWLELEGWKETAEMLALPNLPEILAAKEEGIRRFGGTK